MIAELQNKKGATAKDEDLVTALQVALEMTLRGIKFLPISIEKSSATIFEVEDGNLRMPFTALDGLGESVAVDIVTKRDEKAFTSKEDVVTRTRLNQTQYEEFDIMHSFGNLPEKDPVKEEGLFALDF